MKRFWIALFVAIILFSSYKTVGTETPAAGASVEAAKETCIPKDWTTASSNWRESSSRRIF